MLHGFSQSYGIFPTPPHSSPVEISEELTPEQISLTPIIVAAYMLLELFGAKLKPGDGGSIMLKHRHEIKQNKKYT